MVSSPLSLVIAQCPNASINPVTGEPVSKLLAKEVAAGLEKVNTKDPDAEVLAKSLRYLNRKCVDGEERKRFESAVLQWVDHRGKLPEGMSVAGPENGAGPVCDEGKDDDEEPTSSPSLVPKHRVLQAKYTLRSKAFMLTHNSRGFTRAMWPTYRDATKAFCRKYGAQAWAACWERSENAASDDTEVYHGHMYFFWTDDVGIHIDCLDAL